MKAFVFLTPGEKCLASLKAVPDELGQRLCAPINTLEACVYCMLLFCVLYSAACAVD